MRRLSFTHLNRKRLLKFFHIEYRCIFPKSADFYKGLKSGHLPYAVPLRALWLNPLWLNEF